MRQCIVQVAGQPVTLPAGGQLFDGCGIAAQALVGDFQLGMLLPFARRIYLGLPPQQLSLLYFAIGYCTFADWHR